MDPKHRIYLAGPISGCNDDQRRRWRDDFKGMFGRDVAFEDPSTWGNDWNPEREIGALETSDVVVANMWRESIGTTIEYEELAEKAARRVTDSSHFPPLRQRRRRPEAGAGSFGPGS